MTNTSRRPKIAFLSAWDVTSLSSWSGTPYFMARALEAHCGEVTLLGPWSPPVDLAYRVRGRVRRLAGRPPVPTVHRRARSRAFAKHFERELRRGFDVVFAPAASVEVAELELRPPLVYTSDTTYDLLAASYPEFRAPTEAARAEGDGLERAAIERAGRVVYPSQWAARSALERYGADPARVRVFPYGANLLSPPVSAAETAEAAECRLLFVGRDWHRKGGAVAIAAVEALRARGTPAVLDVVGCDPPVSHPAVRAWGRLRKDHPTEGARLDRLFREAHFLLLPTRAECFGIVFCEASAYGVPSVVADTGGVGGAVETGVNGFRIPESDSGKAFAAAVEGAWSDPGGYAALRRSTRARFEAELNWDVWGRRMARVLHEVI